MIKIIISKESLENKKYEYKYDKRKLCGFYL